MSFSLISYMLVLVSLSAVYCHYYNYRQFTSSQISSFLLSLLSVIE